MKKLGTLTDFAGIEQFPRETRRAARPAMNQPRPAEEQEPLFVVVRPEPTQFADAAESVWTPRRTTRMGSRSRRSRGLKKKAMAAYFLIATSSAYAAGWFIGGLELDRSLDRFQRVVAFAQERAAQFGLNPHQ